ncbi:MAG: hypothetical protein N2050_04995 [Flavobacteriales bacterium]|nr:hypothetical protein [Flavobacteriales bacterium]
MVRILTLLGLCLLGLSRGKGQVSDTLDEALRRFDMRRQLMSGAQMGVLAGWAVGNIIPSAVGWAVSDGADRYFHAGNVLWNAVNLSIALPGLLTRPKNLTNPEYLKVIRLQNRTERIYLINAGLDFLYTGAGLWLMKNAQTAQWRPDFQMGLGRSLVLQGLFLLGFDFTNFLIHHIHERKRLRPLESRLRCTFSASGLSGRFSF